jgi:hypothetical protein
VLFRKDDLADHAPDFFTFYGDVGRGIIDMTIWSALLLKGDAVYLRDSLSAFRIHADQQQNDPATIQRSLAGTRGLQASWRALRLHRRVQPDALLAKPYTFSAEADWMPQRMRLFERVDWANAGDFDRSSLPGSGLNTAPT